MKKQETHGGVTLESRGIRYVGRRRTGKEKHQEKETHGSGKTHKKETPGGNKTRKKETRGWDATVKKSPVGAKHPDKGLKNIFVHFHEKNFEKS